MDHEVIRPGFVWQFPAVVDRIVDGDTLVAHILFHRAEGGEAHGVGVRLEGINAIELRQRFGTEARDALAELAPPGTQLTLVHRAPEKYGRFMSRVIRADGLDVCAAMLTRTASDGLTPLAVAYNP